MQREMGVLKAAVFTLAAALLAGCAPSPHPQQTKACDLPAIQKPKEPLRHYLHKTDRPLTAGKSAFYPLPLPKDALAARLFLIDHATESLDVQYYIYETDTIGHLIAYHLYMAAERGVKVRILLDDISTTGKDKAIATLAQHPNIELKLFNPNRLRKSFRNLALLLDVNRLGKRMHNKALIADHIAAIIGGRNIGDVYYASSEETLFLDYDVITIGRLVPQLEKAFSLYWNSEVSVDAGEVIDINDKNSPVRASCILENSIERFKHSIIGHEVYHNSILKKLQQGSLTFTVAKRTDLFYDHPQKVLTDENNNTYHISTQVDEALKKVERELIIISPYFIPSDKILARFKHLRQKGVDITVITNSLASTDVFPVYGGYVDSIKPLVAMGVHLYELKPSVLKRLKKQKGLDHVPALSLHTKLIFADDSRMVIGSANIDPRSEKLNTELVVFVSCKKLAKEEKALVKQVLKQENFYKLSYGLYPKSVYNDTAFYGPIWKTKEKGKTKIYYGPPHSGFWKRIGADLIRLLPVKGYL